MTKKLSILSYFISGFASLILLSAPVLAEERPLAQQSKVQTESAIEKRVRAVASQLRCPVCQGESIYDSHADVAVEMKKLIREKLAAGASEAEIINYFKDRYGNYILMAPPTSGIHWVIWIFPIFLGLVGVLFLYQHISNSGSHDDFVEGDGPDSTAPLQDIEELRL